MKPALNDEKRAAICGILSVGGTRRMAARYVGCTPNTIRNTAARDPKFRRQLRQTEISPEIRFLKTLLDAGSDVKHWQAAKWALQHMYPERYARRPRTMTIDETKQLIAQLIEAIGKVVPDQKTRAAIYRQVAKITRGTRHTKRRIAHGN